MAYECTDTENVALGLASIWLYVSLSHTQAHILAYHGSSWSTDIVTHTYCFQHYVYWPVSEPINRIVWNTKHSITQPRMNFHTWNTNVLSLSTLTFDLNLWTYRVFLLFFHLCVTQSWTLNPPCLPTFPLLPPCLITSSLLFSSALSVLWSRHLYRLSTPSILNQWGSQKDKGTRCWCDVGQRNIKLIKENWSCQLLAVFKTVKSVGNSALRPFLLLGSLRNILEYHCSPCLSFCRSLGNVFVSA